MSTVIGTTPGDALAAPAGAAARVRLAAPLRRRSFRLIWIGGTAAVLGDQLSFVALAWLALQLTGSTLTLGALLMAAALPRAAFILIGGAVTDRLSARTVAVRASVVRVVAMGLLATLVITQHAILFEVFLLALCFGIADAFYLPAQMALVPLTVEPDELEAANSLAQTGQSVGMLVGPGLGGVVVALLGTGYGFVIDAAGFAVVAATTLALPRRALAGVAPAASPGLRTALFAGLRYVIDRPALRALLFVSAAVSVAALGPVDVGLADLARLRLGGPAALGWLLSGFAAGSVAGSIASGVRGRGRLAPMLIAVGVTMGAGMPALALASHVGVALAITIAIGLVSGYISVAALAAIQRHVEPGLMGRVLSVFQFASVGLAPLSLAVAGVLAQTSLLLLFAVSGGLVLAATLAGCATREIRAL